MARSGSDVAGMEQVLGLPGRAVRGGGRCHRVLLNSALEKIGGDRLAEGMNDLACGLEMLRRTYPESWQSVVEDCRRHPLARLLLADPFTHRAATKPRGYAGDAVMMDYIYSVEDGTGAPPEACPFGRELFAYSTSTAAPRAVRVRRRLIAGLVDGLAARVSQPRVLSLAAGHLREAGLSWAVRQGRVGEYVALDQDAESLAVIEADYGRFGVRAVQGSVRSLLAGRQPFAGFDLVYAAGLYDYLQMATGRRLTRLMFDMLRPGGRLLVPNFATGIPDVGYMEAFMDWSLIYRSSEEMFDLLAEISPDAYHGPRLESDPDQNILFLTVTKR